MKLTNKTYDALVVLAQIILPGAGTLYAALSGIWGLPATEQVLGTVAAVDTFLGAILKVLSGRYTPPGDAKLLVDKSDPGRDKYRLEMGTALDELEGKKQVVLDVEPAKLED